MIIKPIYSEQYAQDRGVLLINLGSPDSPNLGDVQRYLEDFLMDERVISLSPFWRNLLVRHIIVPRRAPFSAANYSKIWEAESGTFPLVRYSAEIAQQLAERLHLPVALAMRYGKPSMDKALYELHALGIKRVQVLPLYPHYTRSSFETAAVHAMARKEALGLPLELDILPAFYDHPSYRRVLADSVRPYLTEPFDKLVVSMHGIPVSHLSRPCRADNGVGHRCLNSIHSAQEQSTCYRLHCERTVAYLQEDLGLEANRIELVYQSRLGRHEWMKPYFARRVKDWVHEGARRVVVVSPGFVCDCLETLEEINIEYRKQFMASGGEHFSYVPCLGSSSEFVEVLATLITEHSSSSSN